MPSLTSFDPPVFLEDAVNADPQLLDADVEFNDVEGDFDGATLTIIRLLAEDILSVRNQGEGTGQIGLSGANITYSGVIIGILTGGAGGTLTITFNSSATSAAIQALINNLTYENSSDVPTPIRALTINITDASGNDLGAPLRAIFSPRTGNENPFNAVDFGFSSTPTFADLNNDGYVEAVVGYKDGNIQFFDNNGTNAAPIFAPRQGSSNPFNGIDVGLSSDPSFVDIDGDGDLDAFVGEWYGTISFFENTGTASVPLFIQRNGTGNPLNGADVGNHSSPTFSDLDGDGDWDMVAGNRDGELKYYENIGSGLAPVLIQRIGISNPFSHVDVGDYGSPALGDTDGDGDLDLVVGNLEGTLK
jgi:hypothetical protein